MRDTHVEHYPFCRLALADAQNLAIRKLLTRAAFESTVTPGPPLPKSHPSPGLAAKLHLECASLYSSARALVKTPGASRPTVPSQPKTKFKFGLGSKDRSNGGGGTHTVVSSEASDEVVPELRHYLADELALHNALAHKWLGVDAGEHGGSQQSGVAVGFLTWSKKELEELKNGGGISVAVSTDREKDMKEVRRARLRIEMESASVFLKGYTRMNDSASILHYISLSYFSNCSDRWHSKPYLPNQSSKLPFLPDARRYPFDLTQRPSLHSGLGQHASATKGSSSSRTTRKGETHHKLRR